jgi:hypothetical protein
MGDGGSTSCSVILLASVARAFDAAFQANVFTFGGTAARQIFAQQGFA